MAHPPDSATGGRVTFVVLAPAGGGVVSAVTFETSSSTSFQVSGMLQPVHAPPASRRMNLSCGMENMVMSFDRKCRT